MNIKIGDVIKFKIRFNGKSQLGTVVEITEVKKSVNPKRIGVIEYHVSTLNNNTINNFTLEEKEIENVHRSVGNEWSSNK